MYRQKQDGFSPWKFLRRFLLGLTLVVLFGGFVFWRVDNPRVERLRLELADNYLPNLDGIFAPIGRFGGFITSFESYEALAQENRELRRELQTMETWREAALQLEQVNAELRALNNLEILPRADFVTGEIIADSGSPYSQSALLNIGRSKGVYAGAPALDGFGLIGRVTGVSAQKSRVLLLTDPSSQISALIMPDRIRAIVRGNNDNRNLSLILIDSAVNLEAGARVVTSGYGVLPADLLIGRVVISDGKAGVRLAADYGALEFARILLPAEEAGIPAADKVITETPLTEERAIAAPLEDE